MTPLSFKEAVNNIAEQIWSKEKSTYNTRQCQHGILNKDSRVNMIHELENGRKGGGEKNA
jgi:hypothetical protein